MEILYRDIAGLDMSYDEIKDLRREARKDEDYKDLFIDRFKKKNEVKYCICDENKNSLLNV